MVRSVSLYRLREDKRSFICNSHWRDSSWNDLAAIQHGLNPSTRTQRSVLFGPNSLDIQGKSIISLLVDEVSLDSPLMVIFDHLRGTPSGHSPVLCIPSREHNPVVTG